MTDDSSDPWAALAQDAALRRVRAALAPRWQAWTVALWDGGVVWCARRLGDGALAHGDHPARLLEHAADADDDLVHQREDWP